MKAFCVILFVSEHFQADGSGQASSEQLEGHEGQRSTQIAESSVNGKRKKV